MAFEKLAELGKIRERLNALNEVEGVKEAACAKQTRAWTHRLDDKNFGVSVMTFD